MKRWIAASLISLTAASGAWAQDAEEEVDVVDFVIDENPQVRVSDEEVAYERLVVRRIDVIDENNVIRTIIAGELPPPVIDGLAYERNGEVAGLMLRNGEGGEAGGFGYHDGLDGPLLALDHGFNEAAGFAVRDGQAFMFVGNALDSITDERLPGHQLPNYVDGKSTGLMASTAADGTQSVTLHDQDYRPRIRLKVTEEGYGAIEFLNAEGEVVQTIAPEAVNGE